MDRDSRRLERLYQGLLRSLGPPGRRHVRGRFRVFYTEGQWERKLRLERQEGLPLQSPDPDPLDGYSLLRGQLLDLLRASDLTPRQRQVALLRLEGRPVGEIAPLLGISERRVTQIARELRVTLGRTLAEAEGRLLPHKSGHYGWQEVLLRSTRRQTRVRRCFR